MMQQISQQLMLTACKAAHPAYFAGTPHQGAVGATRFRSNIFAKKFGA